MSETVGIEGLPFCSASDHHHQQSASTELIYSTIADDHMYSKWGSRSAETASHAASTSGYSSGTESLISNEENSVSLLSLTGSPTQSAKSLLMQSAKSLLTQSTTSLLTQSATSLVSQQARSLLKKNASAQVENVNTVDSPSTRRQSRKRTISKAKSTARNRKWCVLTVTVSVVHSCYGVGRALGLSLPAAGCLDLLHCCEWESVTPGNHFATAAFTELWSCAGQLSQVIWFGILGQAFCVIWSHSLITEGLGTCIICWQS